MDGTENDKASAKEGERISLEGNPGLEGDICSDGGCAHLVEAHYRS